MESRTLFENWQEQLHELDLLVSDSRDDEARANTVKYGIQEALESNARPEEVADFLLRCFREYSRMASERQAKGLFYSWHDEMAGQICCSFSTVRSAESLPFESEVQPCSDLRVFAQEILKAAYADGIPNDELTEVDEWTEDGDDEVFVLTVYVRPTIGVEP